MNVFDRILQRDFERIVSLGKPVGLKDCDGAVIRTAEVDARIHTLSVMTGGRGFQTPKAGPKLSRGGKTRAERREPYREVYRDNLAAERRFREAHAGKEGWGIARIRDCIERGDHLK